jgi:hypothetical protein
MYISASSLSEARIATQLLGNVLTWDQQHSGTSAAATETSAGSYTTDIVDFSPTAAAILRFQGTAPSLPVTSNASPAKTEGTWRSTGQSYDDVLDLAAQQATPEGATTSITLNYSNGIPNQPEITGALAGVISQINESGSATVQPGESSAELNFAQIYSAQRAEGVAGRFYNGTDINLFTANLSDAAKASFNTAYNAHTLSIQSQSEAPAVLASGSEITTTFSSQSQWSGGTGGGYENLSSSLAQTNQYYSETYSPFFGYTVVSWGGPATLQATTA